MKLHYSLLVKIIAVLLPLPVLLLLRTISALAGSIFSYGVVLLVLFIAIMSFKEKKWAISLIIPLMACYAFATYAILTISIGMYCGDMGYQQQTLRCQAENQHFYFEPSFLITMGVYALVALFCFLYILQHDKPLSNSVS